MAAIKLKVEERDRLLKIADYLMEEKQIRVGRVRGTTESEYIKDLVKLVDISEGYLYETLFKKKDKEAAPEITEKLFRTFRKELDVLNEKNKKGDRAQYLRFTRSIQPYEDIYARLESELVKRFAAERASRQQRAVCQPKANDFFSDSQWFLYEPFQDEHHIRRRTVTFSQKDRKGNYIVNAQPFKSGVKNWTGVASLVENGLALAITLKHSGHGLNYAHLIFNLKNDSDNLGLSIGQMTYIKDGNGNLVSKLCLLHKLDITPNEPAMAFDLRKEGKKIPAEIKAFFEWNKQSSISFDHKYSIFDLASLKSELEGKGYNF